VFARSVIADRKHCLILRRCYGLSCRWPGNRRKQCVRPLIAEPGICCRLPWRSAVASWCRKRVTVLNRAKVGWPVSIRAEASP